LTTDLEENDKQHMSVTSASVGLADLLDQIEIIADQCSSSSLIIYAPPREQEHIFEALCRAYLEGSCGERKSIRDAVAGKKGVSSCLLGYVHQSAERIREPGDLYWLRIGLAAAAIQEGGYDMRDFLLALAHLYVSAEEAGIDPQAEFEAMGEGIPEDFHRYAVVGGMRERMKHKRTE
jgi:hypothetical protein